MSHLDDFFWTIAKIVCTCFVEHFLVGLFTMLHKVTWTVESVWVWPFKWKIFGSTVWCCARWLGMNSQSVTTPMKAIERYFTTRCWGDSKSCLWKSQSATTQRKAVEQYFHVVLFTMPFKVFLTFAFVDKILTVAFKWKLLSNTLLSCCYLCCTILPFECVDEIRWRLKWKILSCAVLFCFLFYFIFIFLSLQPVEYEASKES